MQPLSLQQLFDRARAAGQQLPAEEAGLLFAAAVGLGAEQGAPLRPARLLLLPSGVVALAAKDEAEDRPAYLAPELSSADPPRRTEGRVQVYAAGALGYELLCGKPPPLPPEAPGAELHGPLADVIRVSLSVDRRERFGDLQQLLDAIEVVQPRAGQDPQAAALALTVLYEQAARWEAILSWPAVAARLDGMHGDLEQLSTRMSGHEQALDRLAHLSDLAGRVSDVEVALLALRTQQEAAHARLAEALQRAQAARAAAEQKARDEAETREALTALHPPKPAWMTAVLPALLGGAVAGGAVAVALLLGPERQRPAVQAAPAPVPTATAPAPARVFAPIPSPPAAPVAGPAVVTESAPAGGVPPAAPPGAEEIGKVPVTGPGQPASVAVDAGPARVAATPAAPVAEPAAATSTSAGLVTSPGKGSGSAAAAPAPPASGAGSGSTSGSVSPQRMARAVARSQVVRGDNALEKGHPDEAIEQFRTAIENDPDLAEAHRGLGMAYTLRNLDVQARREYERYLTLAPAAEDAEDIRRAIAELVSRSKLGDSEK